ncbi:hypothetical protein LI82_09390 [Methanococcoides methylutens]|uniref:Uncharacterized protein n=1 Tax=Methanococcoides methylutens TaxID=2226 RepID=A0A099SYE7_METMT|nr:hypothetical protein [Methanococcoides methylutens]KGK97955.1 hypothetical protein LI82_09390 [Methanococcoides methylutens]
MRKDFLLATGMSFLLLAAGVYWYFWTLDDVSIVGADAPDYIGIKTTGQLQVVLMNNESYPVDVSIDIENAFVDPDGISRSYFDGMLIISNPENPDYLQYKSFDPSGGKITLQPGENVIEMTIGYYIPDGYDLNVKVYQNHWLLDEATTHIEVLETVLPNLSIELDSEMIAIDEVEIYRVDAYISNDNTIRGNTPVVATNISIIDNATGTILLSYEDSIRADANSTKHIINWNTSSWNISDWDASPTVIIELSPNASSPYLYRPLETVVRGKMDESYRVNFTAVWENQVMTRELVIPPSLNSDKINSNIENDSEGDFTVAPTPPEIMLQ